MYVYVATKHGNEEKAFPTMPKAINYNMSQEDMVFCDVKSYEIQGKLCQITGDEVTEWNDIFEAAEKLGIEALEILRCLRGKKDKAGGFEWRLK